MANPIRRLVQLVLDRRAAEQTETQAKGVLARIGGGFKALKGLVGQLGLAISAAFAVRALARFADEVDEARRTLIRLTGATGNTLRTLQRDTAAVFAQVPESIGEVATAVGNLNTLLGITGTQLQEVTKASLDFARANEVEVGAATLQIGQLINRYGLEASDAVPFMDRLTVAGQMTGASVVDLAERLKETGPILSQLGFSINEQIALFSEFERRGIRGQEAAAGMNRVFTNLAKEGFTDGTAAFDEFIRRIKAAPTDLAAGAIAAEAFGQRAGAKMAVDIRAGVFEIDNLTEALRNADGKLAETEEASRTAKDELKIAANALKADLIPAVQAVTSVLAFLGTAILKLIDWPINLLQSTIEETVLVGLRFERMLTRMKIAAQSLLGLDTSQARADLRSLSDQIYELGVQIDQARHGITEAQRQASSGAAFDVEVASTGQATAGPTQADLDKEAERLAAAAEQITQRVRTPVEVYRDTIAELDDHLKAGRITQETYNRAVLEANDALQKAKAAGDEFATGADRVAEALAAHAQRTEVARIVAAALGNEYSALEEEASGIVQTMRVLAEEGIAPTDERFVGLIERLAEVREGMAATQRSLNTTAEIAQTAGDLVGAAFGGGIGPLAEAKAKQNAVLAAEELAHAFAALANPFTAGTAGAHFAAAAKYTAVAAAWKALAGAVGGSGGAGGVPGAAGASASADIGGNAAQRAQAVENEVHIYFEGAGFDAVNPQVQRVVAGALQMVQERYGANTRVRIHRNTDP